MVETPTRSETKLRVLDPMGYPPKVDQKSMAPRLESLEGKKIYLVDPQFDDSGLFLEQLQKVMARRVPGVKTEILRTTRVYGNDDPETWQKVKENGDGAIIG